MNVFGYIKSNLSILEVISEYTTLKKSGLYYKGACPFHSEKTPSFTVSPHKEIFYCFGCQTGGDVISFIAKAENCSQIEAVHHLVDRYNIELPERVSFESKQAAEHNQGKKRYYDLCKIVATWCAKNFNDASPVQQYLLDRGYTTETLNYFGIGYFTGGLASVRRLISYANKHNFLAKDLINANIIAEGRQILYSPFEERIIFPIKDHLGRNCGFGGRVFKKNDERAKYYNSRENEFFIKGSLLFGLDSAKQAIQKKESVFVVEGYTDCLSMIQHGYHNTVATLGTACTLEHLNLLARQAETMYALYDSDNAGLNAIIRIAELCWKTNLELKVITLPMTHDPASFLKNGGSLSSMIKAAPDIFSFFVNSIGKDFKKKRLNEKLRTIKKLITLLGNISDLLKRDILLQRAAQVFDIPFESLAQELDRSTEKVAKKASRPSLGTQSPDGINDELKHVGQLEKKLFSVIMGNVGLIMRENGRYIIRYFCRPLQTILEKHIKEHQKGSGMSFSVFFDKLAPHEQQIVSQIVIEHDAKDPESAFEQLIVQFQKRHWKTIVSDIKARLARAEQEDDTGKITELLTMFQALKKTLLNKGLL